MFDLRKIFDLRKVFAVPKDFLKSKIYCTKNIRHEWFCVIRYLISKRAIFLWSKMILIIKGTKRKVTLQFSHNTVFFRNQNARYVGTRCINGKLPFFKPLPPLTPQSSLPMYYILKMLPILTALKGCVNTNKNVPTVPNFASFN